jgi:hypothetical protein
VPNKPKQSVYLKLETRIASEDRGGIMHRWRYGRELLKARKGYAKLPKGLTTELIVEATRAGLKLSEREIQRRIKLASVYTTEAELRQALTEFGSWSEIVNAGFPSVEVDDSDIDDPEAAEEAGFHTGPPDAFEQLTLIPGLPATIKVNDRRVPLEQASIGEVKQYRETWRQIHENFSKTLHQIDLAVALMEQGSGGDDSANAMQAWRRATEGDDQADAAQPA